MKNKPSILKNITKTALLFFMLLSSGINLQAQTLNERFKVGVLYYQITSIEPKTVAVTYQTDNFPYWYNNEQPSGDIIIPDKVEYNETEYAVTSIAYSAFYECSSLSSITIPNSVKSINERAFEKCISLGTVIIGDSVTSIGNYAFYRCSYLNTLTIPNSVKTIGKDAFNKCTSLNSLIIPNSVTSIGDNAFYECTSLNTLTIGDSITTIGKSVFERCTSLKTLTIGNSVTSIGENAFAYCGVSTVTIPNSVISIGKNAFHECISLKTLTIGNSVTTIENSAFNFCKSLSSVIIPNSVKTIEDNAFSRCNSLSSITIPNSVTSIGTSAFAHCNSLSTATIGDSVTAIEGATFYECSSLSTVILPNSIKSIGRSAFESCHSLSSITIPDSVTVIKNRAFWYCNSLSTLIIPGSVTHIEGSAFENCISLSTVTIPKSVEYVGNAAFSYCSSLTSINVDVNNANYCSENGILFDKEKKDLIQYPAGKTKTAYQIPNTVKYIENSAFRGCTSLNTVIIPKSITYIGENAFEYCISLSSIISKIENLSISTVDWDAFYNVNKTTCILYVPTGKVSDYKKANVWKEFTNIKEIVPFTNITISESQKTIKENEEAQLSVIFTPDSATIKTVTWSSSDSSIVKVKPTGEIKGISAGSATISATSTEGNFTTTCEVTVVTIMTAGITLDVTEKELKVNETFTLTATVSPDDATNKNVTWTTTDATIATVENGLVTALKAGTATITATTEDGNHTANCSVTVTQPVTDVTLDVTEKELKVNETFTLTATVAPDDATNKNVTWNSKDATIAMVNQNGLVTAISKGITYVKVISENGNFKDSCKIEVTVPVTGITMNSTVINLNVGDTQKLEATIKPENANNKNITWSSNNEDVAVINASGVVIAISPGTSVITATTEDGNFKDICVVTVKENATAINELADAKFTLYPNPVSDILNIEANINDMQIEIINIYGQIVLKTRNTTQIDVSNLATGNYIVKIYNAKSVSNIKIIKQ